MVICKVKYLQQQLAVTLPVKPGIFFFQQYPIIAAKNVQNKTDNDQNGYKIELT